MLEHFERRVMNATAPHVSQFVPVAIQQVPGASVERVPVTQRSDTSAWHGRAAFGVWGFAPELWMRVLPSSDGTTVELRVGIVPRNRSVFIGIFLLVVVWPVGLLCSWFAYRDVERRKRALLDGTWEHLARLVGVPALPTSSANR